MSETMPGAIQSAIDEAFYSKFVVLPGEIDEYDHSTQTATIQITTRVLDHDGEAAHPLIYGVPVQYPRFGSMRIIAPLEKSDQVLLLFASRDIEQAKRHSGFYTPGDRRSLDINDCLAIPFSISRDRALKNLSGSLEVGSDTSAIRIGDKIAIEIQSVRVLSEIKDALTAIKSSLETLSSAVIQTPQGPGAFAPDVVFKLAAKAQEVGAHAAKISGVIE